MGVEINCSVVARDYLSMRHTKFGKTVDNEDVYSLSSIGSLVSIVSLVDKP